MEDTRKIDGRLKSAKRKGAISRYVEDKGVGEVDKETFHEPCCTCAYRTAYALFCATCVHWWE